VTPSKWLQVNLADVIVAIATAQATLAGSDQAQEGSHDAGTV
jgi:hypothetical protein